jgi:hypothetical protein
MSRYFKQSEKDVRSMIFNLIDTVRTVLDRQVKLAIKIKKLVAATRKENKGLSGKNTSAENSCFCVLTLP